MPQLNTSTVRLGGLIKQAEQALMAAKTNTLKPVELTVAQYAALFVLGTTPEASAAQLARACLVSPQTMATIISNLEAKGLVERRASPMHQRLKETRLTDNAVPVLEEADRAAMKIETALAAEFTPQEFDALHELLGRAITTLQKLG